jgi:hypothetical protein
MTIPYCALQAASTAANRRANPDAPRLTFPTEDKNEMLAEVMKHLQLGMPSDKARSILMANGFWHWLDMNNNNAIEEIYRRPRSSGSLAAHLFSSQVVVITLHRDGEVLRKVSLNYFDRDPDQLPASAKKPVSIPDDEDTGAVPSR